MVECFQIGGGIRVLTSTGTRYFSPGGDIGTNVAEAGMEFSQVRSATTLKNGIARSRDKTWSTNVTFRTRVNQADGNILVTMTGNGTFEDTSNTDSIAAGDDVAFEIDNSSGSGSITIQWMGANSDATDFVHLLCSSVPSEVRDAGSPANHYYGPISGDAENVTTEGNADYTIRYAPTYSSLQIFISQNDVTVGTSSLEFRDDGSDTSLTVAIGTETTGRIVDTSNTVTPTSGSKLNYDHVVDSSMMNQEHTVQSIHVECLGDESTKRQSIQAAEGDAAAKGSSITHFNQPGGDIRSVPSATEADEAWKVRGTALTARNLFVQIIAYTADYNGTVITRIDSVDGNQTVTITGTGEFEDTSNTDSLAIGELYNYEISHPSGSGTIQYQSIATQADAAGGVTTPLTVTGGLTFVGVLTKETQKKTLAGGLTFTGALTKTTKKILTGALTFVGDLTKTTKKAFTGGLTFVGDLTTKFIKKLTVTGAVTFVGDLTRKTKKVLAGGTTPSGTLTKKTSKSFTGGLTFTGTLVKTTKKVWTGILTFTGTLSARLVKVLTLTGALTFTGTLTKKTKKVFAGGITPTGALTKKISKAFAGAVTFAGALGKKTQKSFTGALTFAGALLKKTSKTFAGAFTPTGTLTKTTKKVFAGAVTFAGAITKKTSKVLTAALTFTGTLSAVLKSVLHRTNVSLRRGIRSISLRRKKDGGGGLR